MVNNSQGHSAYLPDTLLVSQMNVNPGGKQGILWDGWYTHDGQKVVQPMVFPHDHSETLSIAKGIKAIMKEHRIWQGKLQGKCSKKHATDSCCNAHILEMQPDFMEQKSLVQEVIEEVGHLCIVLPKSHCELNFIEFFWGAVKKYLHDNCDYTFDTLKENMPKALESVQLSTIWKWEHRVFQWMDAYRAGMGTSDAQKQVKENSSKIYTSHCCAVETVTHTFNQ